MTALQALIDQAAELETAGIITGWDYADDDCGQPTLIRINLADGTYVVAGVESDDQGEADGYSWTRYDEPGGMISTDGGSDIVQFAADMRTQAA